MKWLRLFFNLTFTIVGWVSALFSFGFVEELNSSWRAVFFCGVLFFSALYLWVQIYSFYRHKISCSIHYSKEKVNKYLLKWLQKGSRTVIFTRDFTWANESTDILHILERKAMNRELTICLYRTTDITDRLAQLGAEVYVHNIAESQLKSRFTIIDYGTNNPKITVGTRNGNGRYVNERYDMKSNPNACNAFIEMFELVKASQIEVAHTTGK